MTGTNRKGQPNSNQSMSTLRAIIESARNVRADDASPQAAAGRQLSDWADFNGMVFLAKVKCVVEQSSKDGNHYVNNSIAKIITPDMPEYAIGEVITDKPLPAIPDPSTKPAGPGAPSGAPGGLPVFGAPATAKPTATPAGPGGFGGFGAPAGQPAAAAQPAQAAPVTGVVPGWAAK
ncbi:MAG: hypothetical protein HGB02_08755 [Chlorobiaceae bacterium]|nr:hypothetical protein [Chlorobiaceae bacterium]